eukprot:TRINITY_DN8635_c0_g1_i1.p1 TRINITY_DN8635_c0_g1~~TRINITY_DN8635_c0_g1_i1.p1  ORF type:complete len:196 (-),score=33.67 TRINITY_DN8635_c0_g1_i1:97-615(-)
MADEEYKFWFLEVNSQILNALFTLAAFYNHPTRVANAILLIDCKFDLLKFSFPWSSPSREGQLWSVIIFLNLNCIFQYGMAMGMWGWAGVPQERPVWIVAVFLPLSFLCAIVAGVLDMMFQKQAKKELKKQVEQRKEPSPGSTTSTTVTTMLTSIQDMLTPNTETPSEDKHT